MKEKLKGGLKIKINKKLIILVMVITVLLMILFIRITVAKYSTTAKLFKKMEIAKPIFIVEGTETSKISAINNIGYYEFIVKNYDEEKISETGFSYVIEVVSDTDESVKFELYNGEERIPLRDLKTEELFISGNEKIEQKYKLKVTYDNKLGSKGKDILEEVQIKVHSEQKQVG